jgi:hypothetical protein
MVDTPHVEGNMLSQMAEDNLKLGVSIKNTIGNHAESVKTNSLGKAQGRANQPLALRPELFMDASSGISGVEVEGNV